MRKQEERIQIALSDYLRMQYPNVIFTFDASGLKLPKGLAIKAKKMRSGRGIPDLMIFANSFKGDSQLPYYGLFIEIKTSRSDVYLKDGKTYKKSVTTIKKGGVVVEKYDHIEEQAAMIERLDAEGYAATFGFGFDGCKKIIDWYLGGGK